MCFSAPASFTAGASLFALGGGALAKTERRSQLPFASIPLLFGVQQVAEGVIWLSLGKPLLLRAATHVFMLFSHVVWPTLIPLAVLLIEPSRWRRRVLVACTGVGCVVSAYFSYFLATETVQTSVAGGSILYLAPHFAVTFILSPYTVATCASCLFSSHRIVNFFGVVAFLSAVVAFRIYEQTFVSVWCFFAAVLSIVIFAHFAVGRKLPARS